MPCAQSAERESKESAKERVGNESGVACWHIVSVGCAWSRATKAPKVERVHTQALPGKCSVQCMTGAAVCLTLPASEGLAAASEPLVGSVGARRLRREKEAERMMPIIVDRGQNQPPTHVESVSQKSVVRSKGEEEKGTEKRAACSKAMSRQTSERHGKDREAGNKALKR